MYTRFEMHITLLHEISISVLLVFVNVKLREEKSYGRMRRDKMKSGLAGEEGEVGGRGRVAQYPYEL